MWKNWDWFTSLFDTDKKPPETVPHGDFEDLSEETKEKYRTVSSDTDSYVSKVFDASSTVHFSEDPLQDANQKANIMFDLDKESQNLKDFSSNNTLDYIQDKTTDGIIDDVMNWGKTGAYNVL